MKDVNDDKTLDWVSDNPASQCCAKPQIKKFHNISRLDFSGENLTPVNAVCIFCCSHWYGMVGFVDVFTAKEWNKFISIECESFHELVNAVSGFKHPKQQMIKYLEACQ